VKYFDLEFETDKPPTDVRRELLSTLTGQLAANSYTLSSQSDVGVTYNRTYRRWYVIALAICLFPIGLLFLLASDVATITATVEQDDETGGSVLIINGRGPKNVRRGFEALQV
jgi:hypothetical protein